MFQDLVNHALNGHAGEARETARCLRDLNVLEEAEEILQRSKKATVRKICYEYLMYLSQNTKDNEVAAFLQDRLLEEPSVNLKKDILVTLSLFEDYPVTEVLTCLDDPSEEIRCGAIKALGASRSKVAVTRLSEVLSNSSSNAEIATCAQSVVRNGNGEIAKIIADRVSNLERNRETAYVRTQLLLALQSVDPVPHLDLFKIEMSKSTSEIFSWISMLGVVAGAAASECELVAQECERYLRKPTGEIRLLTGYAKVEFRNLFHAGMSFLHRCCQNKYDQIVNSCDLTALPSFDVDFLIALQS